MLKDIYVFSIFIASFSCTKKLITLIKAVFTFSKFCLTAKVFWIIRLRLSRNTSAEQLCCIVYTMQFLCKCSMSMLGLGVGLGFVTLKISVCWLWATKNAKHDLLNFSLSHTEMYEPAHKLSLSSTLSHSCFSVSYVLFLNNQLNILKNKSLSNDKKK